ncbi:uroporphyrinogen-III synthase [Anaplasma capra]|nr:uroporphyrinogen-III synthase [Anaplasma capra]
MGGGEGLHHVGVLAIEGCSCAYVFVYMVLLLTRAGPDSARSKAALEGLGFDVFVEPMFEIVYLRTEPLNLEPYDMVVATSRNGIGAIASLTKERNIRFLTVGDSTMECALSLGFTDVISAGGTVRDVLSYLNSNARGAKVLYARGEEVSCDLRGAADDMDLVMEEIVLYRAAARSSLSPQCCDLLANGKISDIAFYSARTAKIFTSLSRPYNEFLRDVCVYSMSSGALRALNTGDWKRIMVSKYPTEESLFKLLLGAEES